MRSSDLTEIRDLPLFRSMGTENFEALMQAAYLPTFPAQLELIREGDPADFLYVTIEGSVDLFARCNGRETTMAVVDPVGTFVLAAVINDAVYLMSARTLQRSKILLVPSRDVREVFGKDEAFARAIVSELASCYRDLVRDHKNIKLRTAVERLANRLLSLDRAQGGRGMLDIPYDKKTLASLLGMTPENLSRAFNTLAPYGVEVDGGTIRLTDLKSLQMLAGPEPLIDQGGTWNGSAFL